MNNILATEDELPPKELAFGKLEPSVPNLNSDDVFADIEPNFGGDIPFDAAYAFQRQKDAHKTTYGSHIAISPRFDHRWWGVTLPISIGEYTGFRTGVGLRLS